MVTPRDLNIFYRLSGSDESVFDMFPESMPVDVLFLVSSKCIVWFLYKNSEDFFDKSSVTDILGMLLYLDQFYKTNT